MSFQINSTELDCVSMEPEKLTPVFNKLRKKEKSLRLKAQELESKLEMSEIHNYSLVEENCDLKTEIEGLETEISEVFIISNPSTCVFLKITVNLLSLSSKTLSLIGSR